MSKVFSSSARFVKFFNHQWLRQAEKSLAGKAEVSYLDTDVPFFTKHRSPAPAAVAKVREEILAADAVWIFSPVYNWAIPGVVKNLLDWAVTRFGSVRPQLAHLL